MAVALASDAFSRTVAAGSWGSADVGGAWTLVNGSSQFRVDGSRGCCDMQAIFDRQAYLNNVSSTNTHTRVELQSTSAYSGGPQTFNVVGRKTGAGQYQARVRIESGLLRLYILRDESAMVSSTTITHTYVAGDVISVDLSVTGTSPTTIAAKMWRSAGSVTEAEPGTYTQTATDSTAGYQVSGVPGFKLTMSSGAASATYSVDNYTVEDPTALTGTASDSAGATDAVSGQMDMVRSQGDSAGATDAATSAMTAVRTPSDSAGAADSVSVVMTTVRTVTDAAGIVDTPGPQVLDVAMPVVDSAGVTDAASALISAVRALADQAGAADAVTTSLGVVNGAADPVGLVDAASAVLSAIRILADPAGLGDAATFTADAVRTVDDAVGATDLVSAVLTGTGSASVADSEGITDAISVALSAVRTIADAAEATDSASASLGYFQGADDGAGAMDGVSADMSAIRGLDEAVGAADIVSAMLTGAVTSSIADPAGVTDMAVAIAGSLRGTDDPAGASDAVTVTVVSGRSAADVMGVTDAVTAALAATVAPPERTIRIPWEDRTLRVRP